MQFHTAAANPNDQVQGELAPSGKRQTIGHIHYELCYPEKDAAGGDLSVIHGAWVEVLAPGQCEYTRVVFVPFPKQRATIAVYQDGQYAVRHVVVGACAESEPSDAVPASVDLTPPAKPRAGKLSIPCPV